MKDIFIIGSRGLPAQYGGFETFVEKLVSHKVSPAIRYHVACLSDESTGNHFDYKGADCFTVNPPKLGPARVIAYDMMAINYSCSGDLTRYQAGLPEAIVFFNFLGNEEYFHHTPAALES